MGRLPFDQIDVLVVGELGKNYSGAGMDPNVIGRLLIETQPDFDRPLITRLVVLDVSDESHGNIVGVGFADLTTERLVSKLDPESFRINVITSCCLERARIPITLATDRDVIETALETCWRIDPSQARVVVIPNTLELKSLWVSAPLEARGPLAPPPLDRDRLSADAVPRRRHARTGAALPDSIRAHRAAHGGMRCRTFGDTRDRTRHERVPRTSTWILESRRVHDRGWIMGPPSHAVLSSPSDSGSTSRAGGAATPSSRPPRERACEQPGAPLRRRPCGPSRPAAFAQRASCAAPVRQVR